MLTIDFLLWLQRHTRPPPPTMVLQLVQPRCSVHEQHHAPGSHWTLQIGPWCRVPNSSTIPMRTSTPSPESAASDTMLPEGTKHLLLKTCKKVSHNCHWVMVSAHGSLLLLSHEETAKRPRSGLHVTKALVHRWYCTPINNASCCSTPGFYSVYFYTLKRIHIGCVCLRGCNDMVETS